MRLDHLLSRERSEAGDRGAKPEVEARKRSAGSEDEAGSGSGKEAAKSREPVRA